MPIKNVILDKKLFITGGHSMDTPKEHAAQAFLDAHKKLLELSREIAPYEQRYLGIDDLGSAGMEADGVMDEFTRLSNERGEIIAELKKLRTEVGDEHIVSELQKMEGSERAVAYIEKVPLIEKTFETKDAPASKEVRKGLFGRMFR